MGRDRDPFDRALEALRQRLADRVYAPGAALPVNALAAELGVSPTPVREALARLAGEGLVSRSTSGYATIVRDRRELAELYGLAGLLAEATIAVLVIDPERSRGSFDEVLALATGAPLEAYLRVQAQLAPFRNAERALLGQDDRAALDTAIAGGASARALAQLARRYYRRRARRAGEILRHSLGVE
jgi:DNA-binding transcriptional regulator YhcF (GntR family)